MPRGCPRAAGLDQRLDVQGRTLTDPGFKDIVETMVSNMSCTAL